jgi:hypothetical protein
MKTNILILKLTILTNFAFGQNKLIKDIDSDGKKDTIFINIKKTTIICNLSTLNYKSISSKPIGLLNFSSGVKSTKNGFEFFNDWMRSGYKNQFKYNSKTKKIQLIGMSRYEFGNAYNDGSGESSVNLLRNYYIGNWNYYDMDKGKLINIPTIKTKMKFKIINIENFSEETYFDYAEKCAELYNIYKEIMINKK